MWKLRYDEAAVRQLKKLDRSSSKAIRQWMLKNIDGCDNPRLHGHVLHGKLRQYWTYRIGDYRVICDIQDKELVVIAVKVEHRSKVYKR